MNKTLEKKHKSTKTWNKTWVFHFISHPEFRNQTVKRNVCSGPYLRLHEARVSQGLVQLLILAVWPHLILSAKLFGKNILQVLLDLVFQAGSQLLLKTIPGIKAFSLKSMASPSNFSAAWYCPMAMGASPNWWFWRPTWWISKTKHMSSILCIHEYVWSHETHWNTCYYNSPMECMWHANTFSTSDSIINLTSSK